MHDRAAYYRAAIAAAFPTLPIRTIRFLAEGWDSVVWEVNDDLVFRFPKRAVVAEWLGREIALLPELAPTLPVPVPRFDYIAASSVFAYPFVGYRKLPGTSLAEASPGIVAPGRLAAQIGGFLAALHRFPIAHAIARGVPDTAPEQWRARYAAMHDDLRPLFPRMTAAEQTRMEILFAAYLDNLAHLAFAPALIHQDLGGEHLLLDTQTGDLTAVIDWGDVAIGDPAQDFCGLPEAWLPALLARYGGVPDATFAERVAFYRALGPYHTLSFGLHTGGETFIARGLAALRAAD